MKTPESIIGELCVDAARDILKYTPQLYRKRDAEPPVHIDPYATGVLLIIDNIRFIVTAAHVLEENGEPINAEDVGIMIGDSFHILNGLVKYSASRLHRNNEKVDLAIWRIDDEDVIRDLEVRYQFLPVDQMELCHEPSMGNYLIVGFPVSKTKKKPHTKKIKAEPFIFLTRQTNDSLYNKLGFDNHSHLIVEYLKKKIKNFKGNVVMGPDPYGLSGCGLWYIPALKKDESNRVPSVLTGIMHEWRKEHNVLVATRIHIVTETIRQTFNLNLPKSTITKVNLT